MKVKDVINDWSKRKSNIKCKEAVKTLTALGFGFLPSGTKNHKVFKHSKGLPNFTTGSFDCGHSKNGHILKPYIVNILKILRTYENEIDELQE